MQAFKIHFLKTALIIYGLSLSACNLPQPQDKSEATKSQTAATFTAQVMADRSKALETTVQGSFALPSAKVFNLQVCIKDNSYDKAVVGHTFMIEELNKTFTTDSAGCLTWPEEVSYNFLGESQYVLIERSIKGTGLHKGAQKVSFAINPWSHGENIAAVLDPNNGTSIPSLVKDQKQAAMSLKGFSADNSDVTRPLWVEDGRLFVTEDKITSNGVTLAVEMRPNASIQMTKLNGETFLRPVTAGTFTAKMKLIHLYQEDGKEHKRLLSETEALPVIVKNATMAIKASMKLPVIPTRGQVMLGLDLQPVDGPKGLKGFEGVFFVGEYDQIKSAGLLKVSTVVAQTKNFKIDSYITDKAADITVSSSGKTSEDVYQKPKIEVAQLEFRYLRVGNETTSTREVYYNVRACVRNGLDQKTTRAHTFTITKFQQNESEAPKTIQVKTDNNSCINWDDSITFPYFDCQRYLKGSVKIENNDLGMSEKLDVIINPWEAWNSIGRDMRYVDPSEKIVLSCKDEERPKTRLFLDNFNYNTLSYDYGIDANLNMTVKKTIKFKTEPHLLVYSSLANGRSEIQRLRDGIYLLKLAVVQNKDYFTKNTYVTSAETLVSVMAGQVNTDLTFETQDLKALGNRNSLLVEVHPVDESKIEMKNGKLAMRQGFDSLDQVIDRNSVLEVPTFIGPITLNVDESSRALNIADSSAIAPFLLTGKGQGIEKTKNIISGIIAEGKKLQAATAQRIQKKASAVSFAAENNLDLISLRTAEQEQTLTKSLKINTDLTARNILNKTEIQNFVTKGSLDTPTAQKLCAFWANDYLKKMYAKKGGAVPAGRLNSFGGECYSAVTKNPGSFFQTQKHVLVKELGKYEYIKGLNQGLKVGTSFSMSANHSTALTRSLSMQVKAGISPKFLDILSIGADVGYSINKSTSDGNTSANSVSVGTDASMTVQQNIFRLRFNKYEQCAIVRLNPNLFIKDEGFWGRRDYLAILNPALTDAEKTTAVTRGLMICNGADNVTPLDVVENYYLISQDTNSTHMQDHGDARNRSFFVAMRSQTDFNRFLLTVKAQTSMPETSGTQESVEIETTNMLRQLFKLPGPTYPGMFFLK